MEISTLAKNTYRKLTESEMRGLYTLLQAKYSGKAKYRESEYQSYAKKYFPPEAAILVIGVRSEYNDNTYDNTVAYVQVLNAEGREIVPLAGKERDARKEDLRLPFDQYETNEPIEDVVIQLTDLKLEDLYIKE